MALPKLSYVSLLFLAFCRQEHHNSLASAANRPKQQRRKWRRNRATWQLPVAELVGEDSKFDKEFYTQAKYKMT